MIVISTVDALAHHIIGGRSRKQKRRETGEYEETGRERGPASSPALVAIVGTTLYRPMDD